MEMLETARQNMIASQIVPGTSGIGENLKEVLSSLPREFFIPHHLQSIAYCDGDIPLGGKRHLLSPLIFVRMLQAVAVKSSDKVLDIGCGQGYSTAVLSQLANKVIAVESESELATRANLTLNRLGIHNVIIISNKLEEGHPEGAPYDVIFLNGAINFIPEHLKNQLAEGGRMVAVMNDSPYTGKIIVLSHVGNRLIHTVYQDARTHILEGFYHENQLPAYTLL